MCIINPVRFLSSSYKIKEQKVKCKTLIEK